MFISKKELNKLKEDITWLTAELDFRTKQLNSLEAEVTGGVKDGLFIDGSIKMIYDYLGIEEVTIKNSDGAITSNFLKKKEEIKKDNNSKL